MRILAKKTTTAGKIPLATDLVAGEFAINSTDGRMFVVKANGVVVEIGDVETVVALATNAIDLSKPGQMYKKTQAGAATWTFTDCPAAKSFAIELTNGGSGTQTWPASCVWSGGVAPVLQTNGTDILVFITTNGGATFRAARAWKQV